MSHLIYEMATLMRHHLTEIVFGITTVTLVLIGPHINSAVKHATNSIHWLIRFLIFVIVVCVGYGFLSHLLYQFIRKWFVRMDSITLVIATIGTYLVLAWFAKQQKEI